MHRRPAYPTLLPLLLGLGVGASGGGAQERSGIISAATDASGPWQMESLAGVETFPAEDLATLKVVPPAARDGVKGTWRRGTKETPLDEVLFLRSPGGRAAPTGAETLILLREGGELRARIVAPADETAGEDKVTLECSPLGAKPVAVALDSVLGLIPCSPAAAGGDAALLETMEAARASRTKKDVAWLAGESRLEGVLDGVEPDGIRFTSEAAGNGVKIPHAKLRAVILAWLDEAPDAARQPADIRATFRDGTVLPLRLLRIEQGKLRGEHPALGRLEAPLADVRELAFLSGRVSYLSDRQPLRVREVIGAAFRSAAELRLGHKRDRNVLGGPIRLGEREHPKGLGVHSYSLLEYEIPSGSTRFQAIIGLDRCAVPPAGATGAEAKVVFRILLDGKPALEKPMTWQDKPAAVDVELGAAKLLALEVDYGEASDARSFLNAALDRADWADARLVK